jgi:hypothetical protein
VIGLTPRILKSGETSAEEYRRLWNTIKAGREWRGVFHNRRKDGSLYRERASISPVIDEKGRITHFMAIKEDITSFMEAEQPAGASRPVSRRYSQRWPWPSS